MSYSTLESSVDSSSPIELYEFTYESQTQYFTSADEDITIGSITYASTSISRSDLNESTEIGKNNITLVCPETFMISELFGAGPPDDIVTLVIKRVQFGALDSGDTIIIWMGRITTVGWPPLRSEITCESVFTSLRQAGVRRVYTINCPYALYGSECTVASASFLTNITIDTQVGNVLEATAFTLQPSGWYAGGRILWISPSGVVVKRGIKNHSGNQAEITYAIPNFPNGALVSILPGCDHSFTTCQDKFSNGPNFGGFPFMTQKNPWGSSSVF